MKKNYQKPVVEMVEFAYRDQIVTASNGYYEDQCVLKRSENNAILCIENKVLVGPEW